MDADNGTRYTYGVFRMKCASDGRIDVWSGTLNAKRVFVGPSAGKTERNAHVAKDEASARKTADAEIPSMDPNQRMVVGRIELVTTRHTESPPAVVDIDKLVADNGATDYQWIISEYKANEEDWT